MNTQKLLGKIHSINFGFGGYDDSMIGFSIVLSGEGWGVGDFRGCWGPQADTDDASGKWTANERASVYAETVAWAGYLLRDAKKKNLNELAGTPVEVVFAKDGSLVSWRILKEVL